MRVNPGGDPGRDDYGLPPVDIEIPDDARELDRDVQAYYRELRAQRRRVLVRRLSAPLSRDGMVLPLLAGCLALTLLAGTLLTVLTTGQGVIVPPVHPRSGPQPGSAATVGVSPSPGGPGSPLPDQLVMVNGNQESLRQIVTGGAIVLALIPPACRCLGDIQRVVVRARQAGADTFLLGAQATQLLALSLQADLGKSHAVVDAEHLLPASYHPPALTAVLVRGDGTVLNFVPDPAHNPQFQVKLRALAPAGTKDLRGSSKATPTFTTTAAVGR